jgi:hypothetical protein
MQCATGQTWRCAAWPRQQDGGEMDEITKLIEIEAIKQLKARRVRSLDSKDWATYESLHAPEHISYGFGGAPAVGPKQMMQRLLGAVGEVNTVHMVHTPEITITSATTAEGKWLLEDVLHWMQGDEEHWFRGFGHYDETYVKRDGKWYFTSRRLKRLHTETSPGGVSPIV